MENYIIRIYHRDPTDPLRPVGMVEIVNTSETRAFTHANELINIICHVHKPESRRVDEN